MAAARHLNEAELVQLRVWLGEHRTPIQIWKLLSKARAKRRNIKMD